MNEDPALFSKLARKYGVRVILNMNSKISKPKLEPENVNYAVVMGARLWSSPLEYYEEPASILGIKLSWNPWNKCTGVATQENFFFFKNEKNNQVCGEVFDLNALLVQSPESDYETKKQFCFVLRHANRPKGEKLSLAAIDANSYNEWLDFFQFSSADFQAKMLRFLNIKAAIVQKYFRGYREKKNFIETVEKVIRLQAVVRGLQARNAKKRSIAAIITIQSVGRMFLAKQLVFKMRLEKNVSKYHNHRTNVVKEILSTEETYVKDLESVMRFYYTPLKTLFPEVEVTVTSPTTGKKPTTVPNALSFLDINLIFSNLPEIHEHHVAFLARLRKVVEEWNENALVGSLFLEMTAWVNIYITYCNNFEGVTANIERCKKNDIFRKVIESFTDLKDLKKLSVESILVTPIQRLPRYELLLRDLLKHTWSEHPDYQNLQKALGIIRQSVTFVNEARRKDSTKKKVAQFQDRFRNPGQLEKILGEGNFISEGAAKHYDEQGRQTKAYLVLFDDQLVFAKRFSDLKKDGKLNYKKTYRFADAKSIYLSQIPSLVEPFDEQLDKDRKDEKEYGFKFAYEGKLYRFTVDAMIPRGKWVRDLNDAWKKLHPEHSPTE